MQRQKPLASAGLALGASFALAFCPPARAADAQDLFGGLPRTPNLFGDLGGVRTALAKIGGTLNLTETSELLGNLTGGVRRGADYDGLTTATLQLDAKTAFGLEGGQLNVSALQIHGRNLSYDNLKTLQFVSGIEADRATRLWEFWWLQKLGEHADVKLGQQSLDTEFITNPSAGAFVNSLFGWPALAAIDLPGGGPAYPLSALGARLKIQSGQTAALIGVYSGSPAPGGSGDPQLANRYGLSFPVNGALVIVEAQYAPSATDVYKLGAWYDTESFADLRTDAAGAPLGNPANDQAPLAHRGAYAIYAVAETQLWHDGGRSLSAFLRPLLAPQQDRNLIAFSIDGGLAAHGLVASRKDDVAALGFGLARASDGAAEAAADRTRYAGAAALAGRRNEIVLEASYQYQATPWMQWQPDLQFLHNPGATVGDSDRPSVRVGDEWVAGLRVNVTF